MTETNETQPHQQAADDDQSGETETLLEKEKAKLRELMEKLASDERIANMKLGDLAQIQDADSSSSRKDATISFCVSRPLAIDESRAKAWESGDKLVQQGPPANISSESLGEMISQDTLEPGIEAEEEQTGVDEQIQNLTVEDSEVERPL
ncbi:MAG: hypothetical protein M1831_005469 [Alyxoria varia]|nr:MAG: hypothetical protein M1831_005469 [Alyxoria varia]